MFAALLVSMKKINNQILLLVKNRLSSKKVGENSLKSDYAVLLLISDIHLARVLYLSCHLKFVCNMFLVILSLYHSRKFYIIPSNILRNPLEHFESLAHAA